MEQAASRRFAIYLSQGGEFAFVLLTLANGQQLMDGDTADLLAMVVTLSMAITPLFLGVHERWIAPALDTVPTRAFDEITQTDHRVIIAGFGRFGHLNRGAFGSGLRQRLRFLDSGNVDHWGGDYERIQLWR